MTINPLASRTLWSVVILLTLWMMLVHWTGDSEAESAVKVENGRLYYNDEPFYIQGLSYAPTYKGSTKYDDDAVQHDMPRIAAAHVNTIRLYIANRYMWGGQAWGDFQDSADVILHHANEQGVKVIVGYWVDSSLNWDDPSVRNTQTTLWKEMVDRYKENDAVLLWAIGNEVLNTMTGSDKINCAIWMGEMVDWTHAADPDHPVTYSDAGIGEIDTLRDHVPNLDIFSFNHYEFETEVGFQNILDDLHSAWEIPVFLNEYGSDSRDNDADAEDLTAHSNRLRELHQAVEHPDREFAPGFLGSIWFEWTDQWNFEGALDVQDPGTWWGWTPSSCFDAYADLEYFGIAYNSDEGDAEDRLLKDAYLALQECYWDTILDLDTLPPETSIGFEGSFHHDGSQDWITSSTLIHLNATDNPVLNAGVDSTFYRIERPPSALIESVVIIVNENSPGSVEIGEYYAQQRNIPLDHICHVSAPTTEVIERDEYLELEAQVATFLTDKGFMGSTLFLVTTKGVPLKVNGTNAEAPFDFDGNCSSVDSELALMFSPYPSGNDGQYDNPYHNATIAFDPSLFDGIYLVNRLTGPTITDAKALVDRAIQAEQASAPLRGYGYLDADPAMGGGFDYYDDLIIDSFEYLKTMGFESGLENTTADIGNTGATYTTDSSSSLPPADQTATNALLYWGWYTHPDTYYDTFEWQVGAMGQKLHSFNAYTFEGNSWCAGAVADGITGTQGNVYEPYLEGAHYPDVFFDRILAGYTFAEASYMAQPYLSWQSVVIGDPLYTPFFTTYDEPFTGPFTIDEECEHVIRYYAVDNLGNTEAEQTRILRVDNTAPITTVEFRDPQGIAPRDRHYIRPDTLIFLNSTDHGCLGGVGDWTLQYRVWSQGMWYGWYETSLNTNASFTMLDLGLDSHCVHFIEWYAVDALGNREPLKNYTFFLPPVPTLLSPPDGWYYNIGHKITMEHIEESGVPIIDVHYFYDLHQGTGPVEILDSDPGTQGIQWDTHSLTKGDVTEVWVELTDDRGLTCRSPVNTITFCQEENPEPCVIVMDLWQGWNLISIGVMLDELGENYTASELAAGINDQAGEDVITYIVRFNHTSGTFEEFVVSSGIGIDFPIGYGLACYVYSISPFEVEFSIVGDCPENETFDLVECWNLVGYRSKEIVHVGVWADMIDAHAEGPCVQAIVRFDRTKGPPDHDPWYRGDPSDAFQVRPGEAYWIFSATELEGVPYP